MVVLKSSQESFIINVDAEVLFDELIEMGAYNTVDGKITVRNFPLTYTAFVCQFETMVFQLSGTLRREDIIKRVTAYDKNYPWTVASATHILTFGVQYPQEQTKYNIIGLGSLCVAPFNGHYCIALTYLGKKRTVSVFPCGGTVPITRRILAVRRKKG